MSGSRDLLLYPNYSSLLENIATRMKLKLSVHSLCATCFVFLVQVSGPCGAYFSVVAMGF